MLQFALLALLSPIALVSAQLEVVGPYYCHYDQFTNSALVVPANFPTSSFNTTDGRSCRDACDLSDTCVVAAYKPTRKYGTCELTYRYNYLPATLKAQDGSTVYYLKPKNCVKSVAKIFEPKCTPGTVTNKDGCKYKRICDKRFTNFEALTVQRTPKECNQDAGKFDHSWLIGGACQGFFKNPGKLVDYEGAWTYKYIEGSC